MLRGHHDHGWVSVANGQGGSLPNRRRSEPGHEPRGSEGHRQANSNSNSSTPANTMEGNARIRGQVSVVMPPISREGMIRTIPSLHSLALSRGRSSPQHHRGGETAGLVAALQKLGKNHKQTWVAKPARFSRMVVPHSPPESPAHPHPAAPAAPRSPPTHVAVAVAIDPDSSTSKRKRKRASSERRTSSMSSEGSQCSVELDRIPAPQVENGEQQPVQCTHCSKKYRQHNSYYKHLYEHHPFWTDVAIEFALSKHGQVMLMQTAEVLLSFKAPEVYGVIPPVRF